MTTPLIFNRTVKRLQRQRTKESSKKVSYLWDESALHLTELFNNIITNTFPIALDLGSRLGVQADALKRHADITTLFHCDTITPSAQPACICDEEALPFAQESFDLVVSNLCLHWVNDLPGCLTQIRHIIQPGGLFIATLFGGDTLRELRDATHRAETALYGGISPRISPFVHVKDAGQLLQRAGFSEPVSSSDTITVTYNNALDLIRDLHDMGESNALEARSKQFATRRFLERIAQEYQEQYTLENGKIPATFEIITMTGWK